MSDTDAPVVTDGEIVTFSRRVNDLFTRFAVKQVYANPRQVLDGLQRLIEGQPLATIPVVVPEKEPVPEVPPGPIIRVDRSVKPVYPEWMVRVLHPELENVGPVEYDVTLLDRWLHDDQKGRRYTWGWNVYAKLKEEDCELLKTCLGLRDLEEIRKKGIVFFRKHFDGKKVFGWASIVKNLEGCFVIPFLFDDGGKVVLCWRQLSDFWDGSRPALRHAN